MDISGDGGWTTSNKLFYRLRDLSDLSGLSLLKPMLDMRDMLNHQNKSLFSKPICEELSSYWTILQVTIYVQCQYSEAVSAVLLWNKLELITTIEEGPTKMLKLIKQNIQHQHESFEIYINICFL